MHADEQKNIQSLLAPMVANYETQLAQRDATIAHLQQALAAKANATTTQVISQRVGTLEEKVPALATTEAVTQALAGKLSKAGDTATGPIMVPTAQLPAAAPRLDQTYGGLNAPIRYAIGVGATSVAMQPGPLTDPTPQGRKAKPYMVVLTMRGAATALATITVGTTPNGSDVFSKTYLLTGLPVLNNLLAPLQPVFIELPPGTTLYAKATSGTWDVEVFSYYRS